MKLFLRVTYVIRRRVILTITAKNQVCHVLFLGCDGCLQKHGGYCGLRCRLFDKLPAKFKKIYARYYNRYFKGVQFKKAKLRPGT